MSNSWVIWFLDGTYTYAWGETKEDALTQYLKNWSAGISDIVSAQSYRDALPHHRFLPCQRNAVWDGETLVPGMPLYDAVYNKAIAEEPSYSERVNANVLQAKIDDLETRLAVSEGLVARLSGELNAS